jgi:hypothetical protein
MSHEATDPKEVLLKQCGDNWGIPDLDFDKGRRKLVFHFEIIDQHKENPFRPELMGRCRIYFVAVPREDGQPEFFMAKNDRTGQYFITPSLSQKGFKRLREEWRVWHYPPEERGKPVPKMRPKPVFDDEITTVRYFVARWGVSPDHLTVGEQVERKAEEVVPDAQIQESIALGHEDTAQMEMTARMHLEKRLKDEIERQEKAAPAWADIG